MHLRRLARSLVRSGACRSSDDAGRQTSCKSAGNALALFLPCSAACEYGCVLGGVRVRGERCREPCDLLWDGVCRLPMRSRRPCGTVRTAQTITLRRIKKRRRERCRLRRRQRPEVWARPGMQRTCRLHVGCVFLRGEVRSLRELHCSLWRRYVRIGRDGGGEFESRKLLHTRERG